MAKKYKRRSPRALIFTVSVALDRIKSAIRQPKTNGQKRTLDVIYRSNMWYILITIPVPLVFFGMVVGRFVSLVIGLCIMLLAGILEILSLYLSITSRCFASRDTRSE